MCVCVCVCVCNGEKRRKKCVTIGGIAPVFSSLREFRIFTLYFYAFQMSLLLAFEHELPTDSCTCHNIN